MRWAESDTCQFVKIYLSHNCLWNPENPNYGLRFQRQQAYKQIISQLYAETNIKLNETEVRQKLKNLRGTYLQELVKIKQRSTSGCPYRPNMKWFSDYHRCLKGMTRRQKKDTSCDDDNEVNDDTSQVWVGDDDTNHENDEDKPTSVTDYNDSDKDPFVSPTTDDNFILILKSEPGTEIKGESVENAFEKRRKKIKYHKTMKNTKSERSIRSSTDSNEGTREDEFDIYGKYIASQLREMDLNKALKIQLQIQTIVSQARMEEC